MEKLTKQDMHISILYVSKVVRDKVKDIIEKDTANIDTLVEVHKKVFDLISYLHTVK